MGNDGSAGQKPGVFKIEMGPNLMKKTRYMEIKYIMQDELQI